MPCSPTSPRPKGRAGAVPAGRRGRFARGRPAVPARPHPIRHRRPPHHPGQCLARAALDQVGPHRCLISIVRHRIEFGEQHLGEAQPREVGHACGVQPADQVVALVLHHAGVEAFGLALDRLARRIDAAVADARMPGHHATQTGHRQAAFQPSCRLAPGDLGFSSTVSGSGGIGVALVALESKITTCRSTPICGAASLRPGPPPWCRACR